MENESDEQSNQYRKLILSAMLMKKLENNKINYNTTYTIYLQ